VAAAHILSGGSWQCPGPQELVATRRRGDETPYLAAFSQRPSTAGLKHLTHQDCVAAVPKCLKALYR